MKNQEEILRELGKLTEEQISKLLNLALYENNKALLKLVVLREKILWELGKLTEEQITEFFSIALDENNEALLKLAILLGADVTARNNYAIKIASEKGYTEVVELLEKAEKAGVRLQL